MNAQVIAVSNPKSFPKYSLKGLSIKACKGQLEMYDPDTLYVAFAIPGTEQCFCYSLRLTGIDSIENKLKKQELKELSKAQIDALIERRSQAIKYMQALLNDHDFIIEIGDCDKYGRLLATLRTSPLNSQETGTDVSADLIRRNLVFPYGGETKLSLAQQAEFCLNNAALLDF